MPRSIHVGECTCHAPLGNGICRPRMASLLKHGRKRSQRWTRQAATCFCDRDITWKQVKARRGQVWRRKLAHSCGTQRLTGSLHNSGSRSPPVCSMGASLPLSVLLCFVAQQQASRILGRSGGRVVVSTVVDLCCLIPLLQEFMDVHAYSASTPTIRTVRQMRSPSVWPMGSLPARCKPT